MASIYEKAPGGWWAHQARRKIESVIHGVCLGAAIRERGKKIWRGEEFEGIRRRVELRKKIERERKKQQHQGVYYIYKKEKDEVDERRISVERERERECMMVCGARSKESSKRIERRELLRFPCGFNSSLPSRPTPPFIHTLTSPLLEFVD